ncbi:DUF4040 domain-containing protein [Streptomyces thinghirensis]|nr:DUF4040 domain-containing protein [Streptomyces thinghirensis]
MLAGLTGYGTALLFVVQGAPDLALTQFCVETVSMIVFVLVLRRMPVHFEENYSRSRRALRMPVALAGGAAVALVVWIMAGHRRADSAGAAMVEETAHHGLKDVVATILVDLRAWDTMGRVSGARRRRDRCHQPHLPAPPHRQRRAARTAAARDHPHAGLRTAWRATSARESAGLPSGDEGAPSGPGSRPAPPSLPNAAPWSWKWSRASSSTPSSSSPSTCWMCAENLPGGGFVAGLTAGVAFIARYLAGGRHGLADAVPFKAGVFTGLGLFLSTGVALGGLAEGTVLHGWTWHGHLARVGRSPPVHRRPLRLRRLPPRPGRGPGHRAALGARIDRQIERAAAGRTALAW